MPWRDSAHTPATIKGRGNTSTQASTGSKNRVMATPPSSMMGARTAMRCMRSIISWTW